MARKACALIGPGQGPHISVGTSGRLTLRGMLDGEFASLERIVGSSKEAGLLLEKDGVYAFDPCDYVQVSYEGKNKKFIACIITGGDNALFGD